MLLWCFLSTKLWENCDGKLLQEDNLGYSRRHAHSELGFDYVYIVLIVLGRSKHFVRHAHTSPVLINVFYAYFKVSH